MNLVHTSALVFFAASFAPVSAQTFLGYPCTEDCSGHEAGYDWAIKNGISDESECIGNSFVEGCMAAADEARF
jgi:hypothetical protein